VREHTPNQIRLAEQHGNHILRFGAETVLKRFEMVLAVSWAFGFCQLQTVSTTLSDALRNHPYDNLSFIAR
jgi:hypothetical protein